MRTLARLLDITSYLVTKRDSRLIPGKEWGFGFQQCLADLTCEIGRVNSVKLGESKDFRDSTENSQEQARAALLKRSLRILVTKLELYREVVDIYCTNKRRTDAVGERLLKSRERDVLRWEKLSRAVGLDGGDIGEADEALLREEGSDGQRSEHALECKSSTSDNCIVDLRDNLALGSGGSAEVFLVGWGKEHAAAKVLKVWNGGGSVANTDYNTKRKEFKREPDLLKKMRGANHVVQLYGYCSEKIVLVMELMVNGSLSSFLARRREEGKEELEPTIRHQLARDVAQGMVFLHEKNIVHKDLKAENVLLDGRLRAKVSDFGLSRPLNSDSTGSLYRVTLRALAPEAIPGGKRDVERGQPADVYAYGILLWEMATLRVAWSEELGSKEWIDRDDLEFFQKEIALSGRRPTIPKQVGDGECNIMELCWKHAPEDRPVFWGILADFQVNAMRHRLSATDEGGTQRIGLWSYLMFWKTEQPEYVAESFGRQTEREVDNFEGMAAAVQNDAVADGRVLSMLEMRMDLERAHADIVKTQEALSEEKRARKEAEERAPTTMSVPDMANIPAAALPLPASYVERESLLSEVVEKLTATADVGDPPALSGSSELASSEALDERTSPKETLAPYTVFGMGGGGKTVLVSAVVRDRRIREYFRAGIFWLSVGRSAKNRLLPLLQGLAREMGATLTDASHGSLEQVKLDLTAVASTSTSPRMVVLDDVWEREVVDALLSLGLKMLVTARDRSVVGVPGDCLRVEDMTGDEALKLLRLASGAVQPLPEREALRVVKDCAFLPLAVAVIGAMDESRASPHRPDTWTNVHEKLSAEPELVYEDGLDNGLGNVLELSFSALDADAKERFRRLGVLAGGALASMEMLSYLWDQGPGNSLLFVGQLVDKSLVQGVEHKYRLHDLVLIFAKSKLRCLKTERVVFVTSRQARYLSRLSVLREYAEIEMQGGFYALMGLWASVEELSRDDTLQTTTYGAVLRELEASEATADTAAAYGAVGILFLLQGKYEEAELLYKRSLAIHERVYGPDHPEVVTTLSNWAGLLKIQGKYDQAELLFRRTREICEKSSQQDHPSYSIILNNLAGSLREQGKYEEAGPLYERSLAIRVIALGPDHHMVASALNNWAVLLRAQGKYPEAASLFERCQTISEKTFGPEHPSLASTLNNRAGLLRDQGKYMEAELLFERCQAIEEKVLGPEHPDLAKTLHNRAGLLQDQGKYGEAVLLFSKAIAIEEKALGPDHPEVLKSLNNRTQLLEKQGKYNEAEPLYRRTQQIMEKLLGQDHENIAVVLNSRARVLREQGKYEEAGPLYERSLAIHEKALGPDHPRVAASLNNWAGFLSTQGKHAEAQPLFERVLAINDFALGADHPDTITSRAWMGKLYMEQGFFDKASALLEEVVSARERVQGHDHPDVANALGNWAVLLRSQGKLDQAEPVYKRTQGIFEKSLGPDHPNVATIVNNRAALLCAQRKFDEAEPLFKRVLAIDEKAYGLDHPEVAADLNNWARLLVNQDKRAQEIFEKSFGPDHPEVATALSIRAKLLHAQGKSDEAELLYERLLAINEKAYGPDHPRVAADLNDWARRLESQDKYDQAEPMYKRAQDILEKSLGPDHPEVATALSNRAELLYAQGKSEEAEPLFKRLLAISEKASGPDHPRVAADLNNWARSLVSQGKYVQAEQVYKRAQEIFEKSSGTDNPDVATALSNRVELLHAQGKSEEAEPLNKRSLAINEKAYGPDHPRVAADLNKRARLLESQGEYDQAEPVYKRAQEIFEKSLGPDHSNVVTALSNRAELLDLQGKSDEAEPLYKRLLAINEKAHGPDHPRVAADLNNWARSLVSQGKCDQAETVYKRAQEIFEKSLGPDHPEAATALSNRAGMLDAQGKSEAAEPLYKRVLAIDEKVYGPDHLEVATDLTNWARSLESQGKHHEAIPILDRASSIRSKTLGENHQSTVDTIINLERCRKQVREQETTI